MTGTLLQAIYQRLRPWGLFFLLVPIEEPNYIPFPVRNYSLESIVEPVESSNFKVLFREGSTRINGHMWKSINHPEPVPVARAKTDGGHVSTADLVD